MMVMGLEYYLLIGSILFLIGMVGVFLNMQHVFLVLLSCMIMLLSSILISAAFSYFRAEIQGQVLAFLSLIIVTTEVIVGLIYIYNYFKDHNTFSLDRKERMKK